MELFKAFFIAIALAMDSFSVSVSGGANMKIIKTKDTLLVAIYFGFFQSLMASIGWLSGSFFNIYISQIDHWFALILLLAIGGKMIFDSFQESDKNNFSLSHRVLFVLAIATSIDALGVGLSYSFLDKPILITSIIIGFVAFSLSGLGLYLGKFFKKILKNRAELIGGIILISIGIKIVLEHTIF